MNSSLYLAVIWSVLGQPPAATTDAASDSKARLELMKNYVQIDDIRALDDRGTKLQLQAEPVLRFTNPVGEPQDGALYCFAHGTDPEVLLLLESRPGKSGPEWQYAFAPMTTFAVNAFWKSNEVWSLPARNDGRAWDPSSTFHAREVTFEGE
jgi:hypothetical protein